MTLVLFLTITVFGCISSVFGTYEHGYSNIHLIQPVLSPLYKSPLIGWQYAHMTHSTYPFVRQPIYGSLLGAPCFNSPFTSTTFTWPKKYIPPQIDIKLKNGTKHIFKEVYPPGFLTPIFSYQGSIQNIHPKESEETDKSSASNEPAKEVPSSLEPGVEKEEDNKEKKVEPSKAAKLISKKKNKRSNLVKGSLKLSRMPDLTI